MAENGQQTDLPIPKFNLLSDRLLLLLDEAPDKTRGGLIIPDRLRDDNRPLTGRVVRIGPGMPTTDGGRWPMPDVKVGDRVLFGPRYGTKKVKINDVEYEQVRQEHVLAVLEPEDSDTENTLRI